LTNAARGRCVQELAPPRCLASRRAPVRLLSVANNAAPVGVDGRDKHGHDGIPTAHTPSAKFSFPFYRICATVPSSDQKRPFTLTEFNEAGMGTLTIHAPGRRARLKPRTGTATTAELRREKGGNKKMAPGVRASP
jgi:hypothetical protein